MLLPSSIPFVGQNRLELECGLEICCWLIVNWQKALNQNSVEMYSRISSDKGGERLPLNS